MNYFDVIIIGAGAAGLMCAIEAGKRGRKVVIIDHANKVGKKIIMSGGGRCNFTNYNIEPNKFISHNRHFCKSALSRYTQWDFIALVQKHKIAYHEKAHGQLFCDDKSKQIVDMLLAECNLYKVQIFLDTDVNVVKQVDNKFTIETSRGQFISKSLVIATGGLSIPTMGATGFGYNIAKQFGIKVYPTRASLVPVTLQPNDLQIYSQLSGVACPVKISSPHKSFDEDFLFTHRGLSGPAVLQISNYWQPGEVLKINISPKIDADLINTDKDYINNLKNQFGAVSVKNFLLEFLNLPKRIILVFLNKYINQHNSFDPDKKLQDLSNKILLDLLNNFVNWQIKPNATEGYRTAEVTLGGVDCDEVSSKTMEANKIKGLYFIGECLDVTGWLGGYNFQWAWSSGYTAGQFV